MPFDYKKEFSEFYLPAKKPSIIKIPAMNFVAVSGKGNPNEEGGEYKSALELLYGISFTIKMSKMALKKDPNAWQIPNYFDYVVPPLEGLWWQENVDGIDYTRKNEFSWISMIRLPDFVTKDIFDWAKEEATNKKKIDFSKAQFFHFEEGLCVQCLHVGSYDSEPDTINEMKNYANSQGYEEDFSEGRFHHEIYLSDPRKVAAEKLRTVIRHPVRNSCKK